MEHADSFVKHVMNKYRPIMREYYEITIVYTWSSTIALTISRLRMTRA
jgi:hypothetical protein